MKKICLDGGHGGRDPGACGNGLREKDIVLSPDPTNQGIIERVGHLLREKGFETVLTRHDDTFINLSERTKIARTAKCDLFLSIHCNAASNKTAEGYEVWIHEKDAHGAKRLAGLLLDELRLSAETKDMKDRGVKKTSRLSVLNGTVNHMPAVLVEVGFISNAKDASRMRDKYWRQAVSEAISEAVRFFFD